MGLLLAVFGMMGAVLVTDFGLQAYNASYRADIAVCNSGVSAGEPPPAPGKLKAFVRLRACSGPDSDRFRPMSTPWLALAEMAKTTRAGSVGRILRR